jgi:hypothetical protein
MKVWGSGDVVALEARDIMQRRLCNMAASEAKIDTAALFGYGSDGKQVLRQNTHEITRFLTCLIKWKASNHSPCRMMPVEHSAKC